MQLPSRFEKMRANRPRLEQARETLVNKIDRIEAEITGHWQDELSEIGELNVQAVIEEFRRQDIEKPPQRRGWGWPFRSTKA